MTVRLTATPSALAGMEAGEDESNFGTLRISVNEVNDLADAIRGNQDELDAAEQLAILTVILEGFAKEGMIDPCALLEAVESAEAVAEVMIEEKKRVSLSERQEPQDVTYPTGAIRG